MRTKPHRAGACSAIACDGCPQPGRCCSGFVLNDSALLEAETPLHALVWAVAAHHFDAQGRPAIGVPFVPFWPEARTGNWRWWCPVLTADGRCGDHANRPMLCAVFEPATDTLCVLTPKAPAA